MRTRKGPPFILLDNYEYIDEEKHYKSYIENDEKECKKCIDLITKIFFCFGCFYFVSLLTFSILWLEENNLI